MSAQQPIPEELEELAGEIALIVPELGYVKDNIVVLSGLAVIMLANWREVTPEDHPDHAEVAECLRDMNRATAAAAKFRDILGIKVSSE